MSPPPEPLTYLHQAAAVAPHDAYERLNRMAAPTLVVHGERDVFVPPANALVLAERIPGAQLELWPDAAHMCPIDEPRAVGKSHASCCATPPSGPRVTLPLADVAKCATTAGRHMV